MKHQPPSASCHAYSVPFETTAELVERSLGLANGLYELLLGQDEQRTDEFRARLVMVQLIEDGLRAAQTSHQAEWDAVVITRSA